MAGPHLERLRAQKSQKRVVARPAAQIEASRNTLLLAIEMLEQRDELVTLNKEAGRVRHQQRAYCLITRIICAIPDRFWFFRSGTEPKGVFGLRLLNHALDRGDLAEADDLVCNLLFERVL